MIIGFGISISMISMSYLCHLCPFRISFGAEAVARSIDEEVTGAARRQLSTYEWPEEIMGYPWRCPKIGGKSMENPWKIMENP